MTRNHLILYVEDDDNDVFLMQRAFKQAGIGNPLQILSTGTAAMEYLSVADPFADRDQYPLPGLVLLDLKLPGASALEVLKWLRRQPATSTLPVIILTSSNQESDMQQAYG